VGHSVSDLDVLLSAIPEEQVVVGECLQLGCFMHGQAAALHRVGMNEVVAILDPKAVIEDATVPIAMIRAQREGKIVGLWAVAADLSEHCGEEVTPEIRGHVPARLVLGSCTQFRRSSQRSSSSFEVP
jgi:hypothetical protein